MRQFFTKKVATLFYFATKNRYDIINIEKIENTREQK
jgi:hypothetical protein